MPIKSITKNTNYMVLLVAGLLAACSKDTSGNDMRVAEKLDSKQLAVLTDWVSENGLSLNQFKISDAGFKGEYSVVINNNQLVGLKSKGVRSADTLAGLSSLRELELSFFETIHLTRCAPQLETLRINGLPNKPLSLTFLKQCNKLLELKLFHTEFTDWSALYTLKQLEKLSISFSAIASLELKQTLPLLSRLDLTNNQLNNISFGVTQPRLKELFLSNNQFSVLSDFSTLVALETLSLDNNPLMTLNEEHLPSQLRSLDLRKTLIVDLTPLANQANLQRIQLQRNPKNLPSSLQDKVFAAVSDDSQLVVAEELMQKYLEVNNFIETLPKAVNGKSLGLRKQSQQHFSHSGTSKLRGSIEIEEIQGMMRIPLAQTDNLLYQQRQVQINGQITVENGLFRIYSPVEVNFWQMAALFVDNPQKVAPPNSNLSIKGFIVYEAQPSQPYSFQANLIPMADRYLLLVGSDVATGVKVTYE